MKKLFLIVFILVASLMSCCQTIDNSISNSLLLKEENMLEETKKSIVKIMSLSEVTVTSKLNNKISFKETIIKSGSGSLVEQLITGTIILTAGHVCATYSEKQIKNIFPTVDFSKELFSISSYDDFIIIDINGNRYSAFFLAINEASDTCILLSKKIFLPTLKLIDRKLKSAEKSYALGFPLGIWEKNYVPIYFGFFSGTIESEPEPKFSFSIPAAPGISGGPIVNSEGYIIGMIHSYVTEFNVISLSATIEQIKSILNKAKETYAAKKDMYDTLIASSTTSTSSSVVQ